MYANSLDATALHSDFEFVGDKNSVLALDSRLLQLCNGLQSVGIDNVLFESHISVGCK